MEYSIHTLIVVSFQVLWLLLISTAFHFWNFSRRICWFHIYCNNIIRKFKNIRNLKCHSPIIIEDWRLEYINTVRKNSNFTNKQQTDSKFKNIRIVKWHFWIIAENWRQEYINTVCNNLDNRVSQFKNIIIFKWNVVINNLLQWREGQSSAISLLLSSVGSLSKDQIDIYHSLSLIILGILLCLP